MPLTSTPAWAVLPRQRGASLIMVMLILVVVTLIGVSAVQISILGERSARNDRDFQVAFQAAEAALLDAEIDMNGPATGTLPPGVNRRINTFAPGNDIAFIDGCGTTTTSKGLCALNASGKPAWLTVNFVGADAPVVRFGDFTGRVFDAGGQGVKPVERPRYVIEVFPNPEVFGNKGSSNQNKSSEGSHPPPKSYRVTALGFGPRQDIQVVLQTVFRK